MRSVLPLFLASVALATAFGGAVAWSLPGAEPGGPIDLAYGPHLMLPDPAVYPVVPFRQPPGWTGTPPATRSSHTRAVGVQDVLVLPIQFTDVAASVTSAQLNARMNDASPGASSARNFYEEVSYGQFRVQGTVTPWLQSGRRMSDYGADSASGFDDQNGPIYRLVIEAVQRADATANVNFANFDGDGDGVVDHLIVVHAGDAQESTPGNPNLIWSHRWAVVDGDPATPGNQPLRADGVQIYGYIMVAETSPVGVFVHELGHDFDLPDLYDTDGSTEGIGVWDVMGTGSWNGFPAGSVPAHFSAWSKIKLGWVTPVVVTAAQLGAAIDQMETLTPTNAPPQPFKLPIRTAFPEEYFLVENRQRVGFDREVPGSGLLIWHVDESRTENDEDGHRLVDLEEADGNDNPTQAGDPWADDASGFGPETVPNSNSYLNARTGWKVRNIGPSATVMTTDLSREVDDDLAILAVEGPCCVRVGETSSVTVTVANRGARDYTSVPVNLTAYVDSYNPSAAICCSGRTIASLPSGAAVNLTFQVSAATAGHYFLEAFTPLAADEIPENNRMFSHFNAATYYFLDDVEAGVNAWSRDGDSDDPATWAILQDGTAIVSHSPTHAWRFGTRTGGLPPSCLLLLCPEFHSLRSPTVQVPPGPTYVYFWHRYDLRGRSIDNATGRVESDVGYVNVSIDGVVRVSLPPFTNAQPEYRAVVIDVTPWITGPATIAVEFRASANVIRNEGGWWVDDIAVANAPLPQAVVAFPVTPEATVEPGSPALFRFKVANLGDMDMELVFDLKPPTDWVALIGQNQTRMQTYDTFRIHLRPDAEATLLLVFQIAPNAPRGSRWTVPVTALNETDPSVASTFDTVTVINDPFGLAGLEKYVFLFLVVFAAVIVIAVVIDAIKKQRGVYRRW